MTATTTKPTQSRRVIQPKVITTIRLDPDMKCEAQMITKSMGIDLSTFLHLKVTELVRTRNMSFSIPDEDSWLTDEVAQELDTYVKKIDSGEEPVYGPFTSDEFIDRMKSWSR